MQSKEDIFRVVWNEAAVTDNALTRAIAQIRKVLDDDPKEPRFIETVPRMGYRFIGQLEGELDQGNNVTLPTNQVRAELDLQQTGTQSRRISRWLLSGAGFVLVIGMLGWRFWPKPIRAENFAPVPLTTYRGSEESPSFSPDGAQVAFQWDGEKQDNTDIYIKALGPGATPLRLTSDPRADRMPSWSPDGRSIAFIRMVGPEKGELRVIPSSGGVERMLAKFAIWDRHSSVAAAWSADNQWLIVPVVLKQHSALFRISVSTGEAIQITHPDSNQDDEAPTIAPDGKTLMFVRHPTYYLWGTLWTARLDNHSMPIGEPVPRQTPGLQVSEALWLPEGIGILAHALDGVYRITSLEKVDPKLVGWIGTDIHGLAVSSRGNRVAFAVGRGDANIWRIDLTAKVTKPERLIASTYRDVYPQFSPDGRRLAFYSNRTETGCSEICGQGQVWVEDYGIDKPRQLTFVKKGIAGTPHWSPDGSMLTFDSNETGRYQVNLISQDGGSAKQLTKGDFDSFGSIWSPDGKWIYFGSAKTGEDEIFRIPLSGGEPVQVTHAGGWFPVVSADGKTLYFAKPGGSGSVWRMPIAGGPEEKLVDSIFRGNYALGAAGIYFMTNLGEDGTSTLAFYSFATKRTSTIWKMGHPEFGLALSPDQRELLYAQLDDPASDLMLVENFR